MLIVSAFHDYYDSVLSQGIDKSVVFTRHLSDSSLTGKLGNDKEAKFITDKRHIEYGYSSVNRYNFCRPITVLFCGILYPGVETYYNDVTYYSWSLESLQILLNKFGLTLEAAIPRKPNQYWGRKWEPGRYIKESKNTVWISDNYFETNDVSDYMLEHNLSIVLYKYSGDRYNRTSTCTETINPKLSDIDFAKRLDPYTAFQELSMWVGGTLTKPKEIPEVADKYKIQQHGYDSWSFRKHKLDNIKQRKK